MMYYCEHYPLVMSYNAQCNTGVHHFLCSSQHNTFNFFGTNQAVKLHVCSLEPIQCIQTVTLTCLLLQILTIWEQGFSTSQLFENGSIWSPDTWHPKLNSQSEVIVFVTYVLHWAFNTSIWPWKHYIEYSSGLKCMLHWCNAGSMQVLNLFLRCVLHAKCR